jgi:transcriptional regulator with XRE-family HTH domain
MALGREEKCGQTGMYGEKIRQLRKQKGISQVALAEKAGIPQTVISLYERDAAEIPAVRLIAIARALNVSIFELTGYEKEPDIAEVQRQIKKLDLDRLIEALREKIKDMPFDEASVERAIKFLTLLHSQELDEWQIEAIKAILFKKK